MSASLALRSTSLSDRVLRAFAQWFESGSGVWQTTLVVMAVVVLEAADRNLDRHSFILMAVLTVYSAITQPCLAYSNAMSADRMERIERAVLESNDYHSMVLGVIADHLGIEIPAAPRPEVPT